MKRFTLLILLFANIAAFANDDETKTIHVFVALCDNVNQGIVPVPKKTGKWSRLQREFVLGSNVWS